MAESKQFPIFERDTTITPRKLREAGYIPGTIYGKEMEPVSVQLKAHDFELALAHGDRKFRLEGFGKQFDAEVRQIQKQSTKETVLHVEFVVPSTKSRKAQKAEKREQQAPMPTAKVESTPVEEPVPAV